MSQLHLEKNDLDNVPQITAPEGYVVRTYRDGDEHGLCRVYEAAQLGADTPEKVREAILTKPCFKPERLFVVEHGEEIVGTSAAWLEPFDTGCGHLHMVGVLPGHRGKKLGAILSLAAIRYTLNEGFTRQRLRTDEWREDALRLYLGLGFYPLYCDDSHPGRWQQIAQHLDRPELLERVRDIRGS